MNNFLLPFNRDIGAKDEFRVFYAPGKGITAIGQYRWFNPSAVYQSTSRTGMRTTVSKIVGESKRIYLVILADVEKRDQ